MTDDRNTAGGLSAQARELVIDHRWVVRAVIGKLRQLGFERDREELTAIANKALVEWAAAHDGGPGFSRGAWLRVEGAARDHLRKQRRHRQLVDAAEAAHKTFTSSAGDGGDLDHESYAESRATLEEEAFGLVAARLLGSVAILHRMSPEEVAIARQEMQRAIGALDAAIRELPERDRQLLQLHYYEHLELSDVAPRMNPPVPYSSLTRFHRDALIRLGKQLRQRGVQQAPRP